MVPFTMPLTTSMSSPARLSARGRITGIPPPTAASYMTETPALFAASTISSPLVAISSLLAVTTGFPERRAARTRVPAGSRPPMTSTITSIEGSVTTDNASSVMRSGLDVEGTFLRQVPHCDTTDLEVHARLESDGIAVAQQPVHQGATDGPGAEHADPDGHGLRLDSLCSLM